MKHTHSVKSSVVCTHLQLQNLKSKQPFLNSISIKFHLFSPCTRIFFWWSSTYRTLFSFLRYFVNSKEAVCQNTAFKDSSLKSKNINWCVCNNGSRTDFIVISAWQMRDWHDKYDMNANERIHLFFSKESQYLARSSGDLLEDCAILVTALLLMNLPQAWRAAQITEWKSHQRYK